MRRLSAFLRRHRVPVLLLWVVLVVAALPFATKQSRDLQSGGFGVPGSQSNAVHDELLETFEDRSQLGLVIVPERGGGDRRAAAKLVRAVERTEDAELSREARAGAVKAVVAGRATVVPVGVTAGQSAEPQAAASMREDAGADGRDLGGFRAYVVGRGALDAALQDVSGEQLEEAEAIGFPIVLIILLAIFGSITAALLPVGLGAVAVAITGAAIYALAQVTPMSVFASNMASMIGIGVAVDYSLFVLVRYREEIRAGQSRDDARAAALATSGVAIVFSGLTVIVALAGLWLIDSDALRSMALGAVIVVAVAVLSSVTLLPIVISLLGERLERRRSLPWRRPRDPERENAFWERWTHAILRRPVLSALASAGLMLLLASPLLQIEVSEDLLAQLPADNDTRQGYAHAAAVAGAGGATPVQVVVRFPRSADASERRRAVARVVRRMRRDPQVARLDPPRQAEKGRAVLLTAIPRTEGDSDESKALVKRLRDRLPRAAGEDAQSVKVGGSTAHVIDFRDQIFGGLWKIALFAFVMSVVLLTVMLRSIVLPLKAAAMNLLSVAAAYGVMVVVFQWGWVDGFLGFESKGFIDTFSLPLVLAVVFGLSMDYEIFLLSRIRERFEATGDPSAAVAQGLASSARTITSAALIMVGVFAVFVGTGLPAVKEVGLGLAVAIGLDATLVRLVLVPAAMQLFGRWNWWLPKPLEGIIVRKGRPA